MTASDTHIGATSHSTLETWIRVSLVATTVWAVFCYFVEPYVLAYESHTDPLVLHAGRYGVFGGIAIAVLLRTLLAAGIASTGNVARGVVALCIGLMIWGLRDQTLDQWLIARNPNFGPPSGAYYWPLLLDFVILAFGIVPAAFLDKLRAPRATQAADGDYTVGSADWTGLAMMLAMAAIVIPFLMGPAVADTRVKQVYFAVAAGLPLSRWGARKLSQSHSIGGSWIAPFALGVLGVVVAGIWPTLSLPAGYKALTETPAWGLVRPLPLQWISVGLATILWNSAFPVRITAAHPSEAAAAKAS